MSVTIWVKVVGFSDAERNSLNTLFRISGRPGPSYNLWQPDSPSAAQVALVDTDSYEAGLELASPNFNPNIKLICVGNRTPAAAWRSVARPVDWAALVHLLDELFAPPVDFDLDLSGPDDGPVPPGLAVSLMVGFKPEDALYLRARLALAGLTRLDEVSLAVAAQECMAHRHYDLLLVNLDVPDADGWDVVSMAKSLQSPPRSVVVVTDKPSWAAMQQAERMGCVGLLEMPFDPKQVQALIQRV
jgi:CheY-like chemotaxis protein